eukprot:scaffold137_cov398-Prasinococcus_capsulatus_cf.AAC.50
MATRQDDDDGGQLANGAATLARPWRPPVPCRQVIRRTQAALARMGPDDTLGLTVWRSELGM